MTELGEIPSEWEIRKIGELTEIKTGGTPSTKCEKYWKDGDIPWMASGDVNKKIINEVDGRITKSGMENSAAKLLPKDTVMIALNGQGKTKGTVAYLNIELTCNQSLAGFLPSYNVFNSKYLYYNLQSRYFEIRGLAGDSARNGLNLGLLREILIPIPSIKEQEKIASILSTVDEQIDNVDALIEKNKELKKGLMQTLLTKGIGHTKFKKTEIGEIPEEWEVGTLSSIIDKNRKITYGIVQPGEYVECGKYVIRAKDYSFGWVRVEEIFKCDGLVEKSYARARVKEGDVLLTIVGSVGNLAIVPSVLNEANITQQTARLSFDKNKVNNVFYYNYLKSDRAIKEINKYMKSGVQPSLNLSDVEKFKIVIPSIEEQERISLILSSVDEKVEQYENKKQKLEELKKGLMQQLLTGMIRVTV